MKLERGLILSIILIVILMASSVSALDLDVQKVAKVPVVISELKNPAIFDFVITNNGGAENIEIYSLVGVSFEPREKFNLPAGKSTVEVKVYPGDSARAKEDNYAFEYQIKGSDFNIFKDQLTVKIVKLENVLEIVPVSIDYGDQKAVLIVRNVQNLVVDKATLEIESVFYDSTNELSLSPFESVNITLPIKTAAIRDLSAGAYVVSYNLEIEDANAEIKNNVNYREKQNILTETNGDGFFIRTTTIKDTNEGNLAVSDKIEVTKNILTRLFTSFSTPPLSTERRGVFVNYKWETDLAPGDSWSVEIKTNYTLPFALIILVLFSAGAVYVYSRTSLVVRKRCSFVKTRGGEFALKVTLHLKARKTIDNISLFDRIPMATKLYTKSGMPHNFDERLGKLNWKIDKLNSGEERIFSYIIYSSLRIVGRLELPPATVNFVENGKTTYVHSNRTYFVSDVNHRF